VHSWAKTPSGNTKGIAPRLRWQRSVARKHFDTTLDFLRVSHISILFLTLQENRATEPLRKLLDSQPFQLFASYFHVGTGPSSFCPTFTHLLHQTHCLHWFSELFIPCSPYMYYLIWPCPYMYTDFDLHIPTCIDFDLHVPTCIQILIWAYTDFDSRVPRFRSFCPYMYKFWSPCPYMCTDFDLDMYRFWCTCPYMYRFWSPCPYIVRSTYPYMYRFWSTCPFRYTDFDLDSTDFDARVPTCTDFDLHVPSGIQILIWTVQILMHVSLHKQILIYMSQKLSIYLMCIHIFDHRVPSCTD